MRTWPLPIRWRSSSGSPDPQTSRAAGRLGPCPPRGEGVVIDLVHDRTPQIHPEKLDRDGVLVDSAAEIFANKLCTLLSRGEVRDLVDVMFLERAGLRVEDAIGPAATKDGGLTAAQLAWVLSQITVGPDARIPAGVTPVELRAFLEDLVSRLTRLAYPVTPTP